MTVPGSRRARPVTVVFALAVAMFAGTALVGCAPERVPMPTPSPTKTYVSTYEAPPPTELAPLRGTTVPAGSLDHASIAAKIDNHWDARPQVGLETADIVFEELVEGGITRYVAIWHSVIPELIGPVRSIRPMDPDIISPFRGIVCYSGGQQRFVALMRQTPVYNAIHGQADTADSFYRADGRPSPHDVIVQAQEVLAHHTDLAAPPQQFAYSLNPASSTAAKMGTPTAAVDYRFSYSFDGTWTYDPETELYYRVQDGDKDLDNNGDQLTATNVVLLRVGVVDDRGVPKTQLFGEGEAWVSTGGGTVHGTWSKSSAASSIRLIADNGVTIRLAAGNTWVELVPHSGDVSITTPAGP